MKCKWIVGPIAIFSFCLPISVATAEKMSNVADCSANSNAKRCYYLFRYENAKEYEQPSTGSRSLSTWGWGSRAYIDWSRAKNSAAGWLPTLQGAAGKTTPYGWVEVKDLVSLGELKQVTGCWPVASIQDGVGDSSWKLTFTVEGNVSVDDKKKSQVSFAPNVVLIVDADGGYIFYGFDQKIKKIRQPNTGKEPEKVTYFPPDQLKGCEGGLKLEK